MAGSDDRGRERRRHDRTPVGLLVQYRLDAVSDFLAEYAADLSPGGMFIHTRARVAVGTRLQVRFSPRDGSRLVELRGRVVHALAGARPGIGLELLGLDAETAALIRRVCAEHAPSRRATG